MSTGWLERTSEPLDCHTTTLRDDLRANPRKLSVPVHRQQVAAAELEEPVTDPVEILMHCEECDQVEGCECGTHLSEYYAANQPTMKGK
jgi:hypothetical protein